jgi:hypothetical protein
VKCDLHAVELSWQQHFIVVKMLWELLIRRYRTLKTFAQVGNLLWELTFDGTHFQGSSLSRELAFEGTRFRGNSLLSELTFEGTRF